jgi:2-amino-4-hydroxy-6-hydroxymethyldihydropteridine diphosphokinase
VKGKDRQVPMHLATVGLGSNLGDRASTIRKAIEWLAGQSGNLLMACSSLYEAEPVGKTDQGWFLNCVIQVRTARDLLDFFHLLQHGEAVFGRVRKERWGPRTLDMDLLFFDEVVYSDSEITVPHPAVPLRRFVLEPLCEVAPDLVHPSIGAKASNLLEQLVDPSRVVRLASPPVGVSC